MELEFDSNDVMAYIHAYCAKKNYYVNVTKLQKLLYCSYGTVLARFNERLTQEHPQAWEYGPVFPRTFNAIKKGTLSRFGRSFESACPPEVLSFINETVDVFAIYSASALSNWTHKAGSPWDQASNGGENLYGPLDDLAISKYFAERVLSNEN